MPYAQKTVKGKSDNPDMTYNTPDATELQSLLTREDTAPYIVNLVDLGLRNKVRNHINANRGIPADIPALIKLDAIAAANRGGAALQLNREFNADFKKVMEAAGKTPAALEFLGKLTSNRTSLSVASQDIKKRYIKNLEVYLDQITSEDGEKYGKVIEALAAACKNDTVAEDF